MASATLTAPEPLTGSDPADPRSTYTCPECEHVLRVFGRDRHRVYFELGDERLDAPVMTRACPACGHRLPGKNPA